MKKFALSVLLSISLALFGAQASFAESVVVKDGLVFIADGNLVVKDLATSEELFCAQETGADLSTATDVVVLESEGVYTAVVTIHPVDSEGTESTDFAPVDVTLCYPEVVAEPVEEVVVDDCYAYLEGDTLHIPCILYTNEEGEENVIGAEFNQNGNSQNWKASGVFKNITVSNHHHSHHDDDEGDDE